MIPRCPTCKVNSAVRLIETVQACEECYEASSTTQAVPANPRQGLFSSDPTGLVGHVLVEWCRNNPNELIKMSDTIGNEHHPCRAIVYSKIIDNNRCREAYRHQTHYSYYWAPTTDYYYIHAHCQCYGIWSLSDPAPWNPNE